jgi:hypothetical protein
MKEVIVIYECKLCGTTESKSGGLPPPTHKCLAKERKTVILEPQKKVNDAK